MAEIITANSAETLSVFFRPGQDKRLVNSNSDSIFTFGDFRIERASELDTITGTSENLGFGPFSTLDSLDVNDFNPLVTQAYVSNRELNLPKTDPLSYTYFASFYTEISNSVNNILDNFPYAILSNTSAGNTIFDYSSTFNLITNKKTSTFKVPVSTLINQGDVIINSGSPITTNSLVSDTSKYGVQLSGVSSANTTVHKIISYNYSGAGGFAEFVIEGFLLDGSSTTSSLPFYIRPSKKRFEEFQSNLSRLEHHTLNDGSFLIPNVDDDGTSTLRKYTWPKTIDGFNPDTRGSEFELFKEGILKGANSVDEAKTNILLKTVIPENYLDFDTDTKIYRKLVQTYASEIDTVKNYIDAMAYAHSITYSGEESTPNKFLFKLSKLLGWNLSASFNEIDLFEYLTGDSEGEGNSHLHYNLEVWKRILVNLNWLYKKKGTRDALQFIFKLIGAPDCLIGFDEFVYDIEKTTRAVTPNSILSAIGVGSKIDDDGYLDFDKSDFDFQEGGPGRGTGKDYINQWEPEFKPSKRVDNIKTQVGDPLKGGTRDIINTKELCLTIDPARAIECDVFEWYQLSGTCWVWGSLAPPFSSLTVPFEYTIDNCDFVAPSTISGMTFNEYIKFIYKSNIDPRNRKTNHQTHTMWHYPEMRKIYLNYFYLSDPRSHMLTIKKLEPFLDLLEVQVNDYLFQLLPATTILECQGTVYRNTVFNRQRFVYKEGINRGSEFQVPVPVTPQPILTPIQVESVLNDYIQQGVNITTINATVGSELRNVLTPVKIIGTVIESIDMTIKAHKEVGVVEPTTGMTKTV